ncbi:MAG TPA: DUF1016 N-terminal domain-containing protein [Methanospirillum sp.]|nr:DUF1016 N-terminal domain-containing protein [Methanospirillum sp.]
MTTARITAVHNINILQVRTNFEIGGLIVEYEPGGSERAGYGKQTLPELSKRLTNEFGRGYSRSNLENMRRFYIDYHTIANQISQTLSGNSPGHDPKRIPHLKEETASFPLGGRSETVLRTDLDAINAKYYGLIKDEHVDILPMIRFRERMRTGI